MIFENTGKKSWNELDDNGDLKWGTVRTTVLEEAA